MAEPAPTAPSKRSRAAPFWGWWIVVGAVVGQFAATGAQGQISGVFLRPMVDELGWTVGQFTLATSAAFVVGGVAGLIIGPMVDRYGPRRLMFVGAFGFGSALLLMSRVTAVWQFVALQILAGGVGSSLVGPLVVNTTVAKWFVIRRGWAIALGSMGVSLAALTMPVTMTRVVDRIGWRDGYVVLAVVIFVLLLAVVPLMRSRPEAYGLLPDGKTGREPPSANEQRQLAQIARDMAQSYTRAEAVRTPAMWLLVIGFGLNIAGLSAVLVHGIPFMTDAGFTRSEASLAFSVTGLANLLSKFLWGWTLQRFDPRRLAGLAFGCSSSGIALLLLAGEVDSLAVLFSALFIFGLGFGGTIPISEFLWAHYFGRRHLGAVRSVGMPFTIVFGSAGPIGIALYFDGAGSYGGAFVALAVTYAIAGLAILASRRPPGRDAPVAAATAAPLPAGG